jgi:hypothetical protein
MSVKHTYLTEDGPVTKTITKAKAIRAKCLDCCAFQQGEVKKCVSYDCPLYPFRFGNEKGNERKWIPEDHEDEIEDEDEEELDVIDDSTEDHDESDDDWADLEWEEDDE